jgi:putative thiamine transport system ATP-binding protein
MSALELRNVSLAIAGRSLIGPINVTAGSGEIVALLGPTGVGKSSLLNFLCGVLPKDFTAQGEVWLDGRNITCLAPQQRGVGILFQDDLLFPHLSVAGNLAFGLHPSERSRRARARIIEQALESMGLEGFGGRDPATLSGGQRARVGLLRVLLSRPKALLLDEPFAQLDQRTRTDVRQLVFDEVRRRALPTLLVTHDVEDVRVTGGACLELKPLSGGERCSTLAYSP